MLRWQSGDHGTHIRPLKTLKPSIIILRIKEFMMSLTIQAQGLAPETGLLLPKRPIKEPKTRRSLAHITCQQTHPQAAPACFRPPTVLDCDAVLPITTENSLLSCNPHQTGNSVATHDMTCRELHPPLQTLNLTGAGVHPRCVHGGRFSCNLLLNDASLGN